MSEPTKREELAAVLRNFEIEHLSNIKAGIRGPDVTKAFERDLASVNRLLDQLLPVELAVAVETSAPEIAPVDPFTSGEPTGEGIDPPPKSRKARG